MITFWLISIPLLSAVLGGFLSWLLIRILFRPHFSQKWLGLSCQGVIPKNQRRIAVRIGNLLEHQLISSIEMEEKLLDPGILQKITPEIALHIDYFLRVKLKDAIPMVAMFVGEKTIVQLKEVFMKEMTTLFPEIMKKYMNELQKDLNIGEKISAKLASLPPQKIESLIVQTLKKEIRYVYLAGMILGFIIGGFQVIITLFLFS